MVISHNAKDMGKTNSLISFQEIEYFLNVKILQSRLLWSYTIQ